MNLEISIDHDAEQIDIILDNHMTLSVHRDIDGDIVYSKNFNDIVEDEIYDSLKSICNTLMNKILV